MGVRTSGVRSTCAGESCRSHSLVPYAPGHFPYIAILRNSVQFCFDRGDGLDWDHRCSNARNWPGVSPAYFRKARLKLACELKSVSRAISTSEERPGASMVCGYGVRLRSDGREAGRTCSPMLSLLTTLTTSPGAATVVLAPSFPKGRRDHRARAGPRPNSGLCRVLAGADDGEAFARLRAARRIGRPLGDRGFMGAGTLDQAKPSAWQARAEAEGARTRSGIACSPCD